MGAKLERTDTPGIYRRQLAPDKNGKPRARYVVVVRDLRGRQHKHTARTKAEAKDLKAQITADVKRGEYQALSRVTFADYACEWIGRYPGSTSRGIREATRDDYRRRLGLDKDGRPVVDAAGKPAGAIAYFGRMRLTEIEPGDIIDYARTLSGRGLAPNTVRLFLAPVKAMLSTAVAERKLRSNPSAGLRLALGRTDEPDEEHVKALTEEELGKVLQALPPEWLLFFEFLAQTGLRIGEAIALRWQDVDLSRRRVHVRRRYYRGTFAPPKSKYGRRDVPISKRLAQELELRWLLEADVERLVFPSSTGTVLDASNLMRRVLKPAARRAGVPWAGFHTFRHTCATLIFRRGLNAKQAQVWLGHHSPAFTLATYVHLIPDDLPDIDVFEDAPTGTQGQHEASESAEASRDATGDEEAGVPAEPRSDSADLTSGSPATFF